ncbi:MAG TPA: multiheme c-type cytochrome [Kofleriaceae bacterium]
MKPATGQPTTPTKPSFTIFALAEVRGQIGPCGCTSDPLGDISRTTQLISDAEKDGPVLVVDAGSLLYSQNPVPAHLAAQEDLKADLLANIYKDQLRATAVGLGPADTAMGPDKERFPRVESNVTGEYATKPAQIAVVGGQKIGVFGVIAEDAFKVQISDPVAAGKKAVKELREGGAQVVVALLQASTKKEAVTLAKAIGGIDLAVAGLGQNAPEPEAIDIEPTKLDFGQGAGGWLVIPGNRGQIVSRIDVYERGAPSPLADAIGAAAAKAKIAQLDKDLASRDAELARFAADKTADQAFVAAKQKERAQVAAEREQLTKQPLVVPATGSYFTLDQVKINKTLACSVKTQDLVTAFYAAAGAANVKAAEGKAPEPAAKGKPSYVGSASCGDCHDTEAKFWDKTVHAQAWKTLVDRGQQFDYDCIGCHVTGWQQPGGSNLAHNDTLRDIQCETCHGPASIHVDKGGNEKPLAIVLDPPENLCASQCHTKEHSDTFQHDAYLRDIVGPGHGEKRRAKLGDGPTGASLRKAALDKAGKSLGANCTR